MLTKAFKKAHPATPWKFVQGMRHVLVHDYVAIDDRELYNTAVNDLPLISHLLLPHDLLPSDDIDGA